MASQTIFTGAHEEGADMNDSMYMIKDGIVTVTDYRSKPYVRKSGDVIGEGIAMRLLKCTGPREHISTAKAVTNVDSFVVNAESFTELLESGQYPLVFKLIRRVAIKMSFHLTLRKSKQQLRYTYVGSEPQQIVVSPEYPGTPARQNGQALLMAPNTFFRIVHKIMKRIHVDGETKDVMFYELRDRRGWVKDFDVKQPNLDLIKPARHARTRTLNTSMKKLRTTFTKQSSLDIAQGARKTEQGADPLSNKSSMERVEEKAQLEEVNPHRRSPSSEIALAAPRDLQPLFSKSKVENDSAFQGISKRCGKLEATTEHMQQSLDHAHVKLDRLLRLVSQIAQSGE